MRMLRRVRIPPKQSEQMKTLLLALTACASLHAQNNWASFGQDQAATRFSKLNQINTANVATLTRAWTFHTGVTNTQNEMTPIVIDSVMYLSAANGYFAVDAITGTQIWKYNATGTTERGVSYRRREISRARDRRRRQQHRRARREDGQAHSRVRQRRSRRYWHAHAVSAFHLQRDDHRAQHGSPRARVEHPHRRARVDFQPGPAARRTRARNLGKRCMENHWRRERLGPHHGG